MSGMDELGPGPTLRLHSRSWPCRFCWATEDGGGEIEPWIVDAHSLAYLERMRVQPSLMLRRVADRYPEFEWLVFLPAEERRWYMTVGDQEYVRQSWFIHLAPWAYEALVAS